MQWLYNPTKTFSPLNSRIQMYGVRSWKCDHLRNANCGHRRSAQSVDPTCKKATTYVKLSEKHFFDCLTFPSQALRTSNHRVFKLRLARPLPITPPLTRGNQRSLMSWLAQGHVYNSILKFIEPNLANETTWKIGPLTPSLFGCRNSQVWLYFLSPFFLSLSLFIFSFLVHHQHADAETSGCNQPSAGCSTTKQTLPFTFAWCGVWRYFKKLFIENDTHNRETFTYWARRKKIITQTWRPVWRLQQTRLNNYHKTINIPL